MTPKHAAIWRMVRAQLESHAPGTILRVPKTAAPSPREAGADLSVGWPVGQQGDFRFGPESDCRGLHVREFEDRWEAHLDAVHPACSVLDHMVRDAPDGLVLGGVAVGALVGLAVSRDTAGAVAGAGLGALGAILLLAMNPPNSQKKA